MLGRHVPRWVVGGGNMKSMQKQTPIWCQPAKRLISTGLVSTALFLGGTAGSTAGCASDPCDDNGDSAICGVLGTRAFSTVPDPEVGRVRWPAVATAQSSILIAGEFGLAEVDQRGDIEPLQDFEALDTDDFWTVQPTGISPPSLDSDGTAFVVRTGAIVDALAESGTSLRWSETVTGEAPAGPPALGDGVVHVAMRTEEGAGRALLSLDAITGIPVATREGATQPVLIGEELAYLNGPRDCGTSYDEVVVEDGSGNTRFRFSGRSGVRDFAPGPEGELYVVTDERTLVRLNERGQVVWTFEPNCPECTVAAAPTVTDDAVYFPVWEGTPPNTGCEDPDPNFVEGDQEFVDPLYALRRDGSLMWSYDGFYTLARSSHDLVMSGMLGLVMTERVQHHPAGRPIVADDGTLFVPTDGAVVTLDADGNELGFALFDPSIGEGKSGMGVFESNTGTTGGNAPPPVLADDGTLYTWDGMTLRGFATGKTPAQIPWSAPFGGQQNAGRVVR